MILGLDVYNTVIIHNVIIVLSIAVYACIKGSAMAFCGFSSAVRIYAG